MLRLNMFKSSDAPPRLLSRSRSVSPHRRHPSGVVRMVVRPVMMFWKSSRLLRRLLLLAVIVFGIHRLGIVMFCDEFSCPIPTIRPSHGDGGSTWEYGLARASALKPRGKAAAARSAQLEEHKFLSNGLMVVNPRGRHPIYDLILRAEKEWQSKMDRQSKTLAEAVQEYERRYRRKPPRGFDKWWAYVQHHNVQLPDEYDQIFSDLEMFYAHSPAQLRALQAVTRQTDTTYSLASDPKTGNIDISTSTYPPGSNEERGAMGRARAQLDLLHGYGEEWELPDGSFTTVEKEIVAATGSWEATFSTHDGPHVFGNWDLYDKRRDMLYAESFMDPFTKPDDIPGWAQACPPDSPLRTQFPERPKLPIPDPAKKSFIYNHRKAMNPCDHPSVMHLSGFFSVHNKGPGPHKIHKLIFGMSKTDLFSDIMIVPYEGWTETTGLDPDWADKQDDRLGWRGSTTGIHHAPQFFWQGSHRSRMVAMLNTQVGNRTVLHPGVASESVGEPDNLPSSWLNNILADVAFTEGPMQCAEGACEDMNKMFEWRTRSSPAHQNRYKYIIDMDGNGWSSRFKRLITSKSAILKATIFPEWYADRIMPWVHYIPVKFDLTDLYDIMTFFRGDIRRLGENGHDELAERIALAGTEWSYSFFRKVDMVAYTWRLFLEYGRLVSDDRSTMNFELVP